MSKPFNFIWSVMFVQSVTRVKPYICTMPMRLDEGWNQIQLNLADFTRRAYGTNYVETLRVQIHANCRVRRIYFSDRLYTEEELPPEFKIFLPIQVSGFSFFFFSFSVPDLCNFDYTWVIIWNTWLCADWLIDWLIDFICFIYFFPAEKLKELLMIASVHFIFDLRFWESCPISNAYQSQNRMVKV